MPPSNRAPTALDRLQPRDGANGGYIAVIEAEQGSRNKLEYDPDRAAFVLHAVLPLGTAFPYDFGFIPGTLADDGDPIDVLVFTDEPVPATALVPCRLIGVIEATQGRGRQRGRNDRLLAVALETHRYRTWRSLRDVPRAVLDEIERFFAFYNEQRGVRVAGGAPATRGRHGQRKRYPAAATSTCRAAAERPERSASPGVTAWPGGPAYRVSRDAFPSSRACLSAGSERGATTSRPPVQLLHGQPESVQVAHRRTTPRSGPVARPAPGPCS